MRFVPHHVAHAASAHLAAPFPDSSVLVLDGRGERASHLAGRSVDGDLEVLAAQELPHSLGLMYEEVTEHLGFLRSNDEYKVMAMASYGQPVFLPELRELVRATGDGGFSVEPIDWGAFAKALPKGGDWQSEHADLAASVQRRLEEVLLDLARWLHDRTGDRVLTMAGGVALNCVANSRLPEEGPSSRCGSSPRPATPARPSARRSTSPRRWATASRPCTAPTSAAASPTTRSRAGWSRPRSPTSGRPTSPTPWPRCWPPTASSPGSRAAASTAPGPSATAACWPTPATPATSSASTT